MKQYDRIINSILDNDLYKLTMCMAVFALFPRTIVKYSFILRKAVPFPPGFGAELRRQLSLMADLKMTKEEKEFMLGKDFEFLAFLNYLGV